MKKDNFVNIKTISSRFSKHNIVVREKHDKRGVSAVLSGSSICVYTELKCSNFNAYFSKESCRINLI